MAESTSIHSIKAEALREAAEDFRRAAAAGIEPTLNLAAARLLSQRADRVAAPMTIVVPSGWDEKTMRDLVDANPEWGTSAGILLIPEDLVKLGRAETAAQAEVQGRFTDELMDALKVPVRPVVPPAPTPDEPLDLLDSIAAKRGRITVDLDELNRILHAYDTEPRSITVQGVKERLEELLNRG